MRVAYIHSHITIVHRQQRDGQVAEYPFRIIVLSLYGSAEGSASSVAITWTPERARMRVQRDGAGEKQREPHPRNGVDKVLPQRMHDPKPDVRPQASVTIRARPAPSPPGSAPCNARKIFRSVDLQCRLFRAVWVCGLLRGPAWPFVGDGSRLPEWSRSPGARLALLPTRGFVRQLANRAERTPRRNDPK